MHLQDLALLERIKKNLDELIHAGRKLGPLYVEGPKQVADVTRKAKWLRAALLAFETHLDAKERERQTR